MARARSKRVGRKSEKKENRFGRYSFYFATLAMIFVMIFSAYKVGIATSALNNSSLSNSAQASLNAIANRYDNYFTIALELFFPLIVFSYLLIKGKNIKRIIEDLHLSRKSINLKVIGFGILIFLAILLLGFAISEISAITNIPLPTNVAQVLSTLPLYLLIFTFVVAPICEEILFRGFLVPRIGIIASAIIFALLHLGYLSVSEFVAALLFGLLAGYALKKTKSLYTSIIAHALVNFLTVATIALIIIVR